jgi:multidrug resistance efflux pump
MKDAAQATKRVKEIRRDLQALTEDYKTGKINIELEHAKALKRLQNDYEQRSKFLQHEIENMGESLAS